jgi:hypothetical protein
VVSVDDIPEARFGLALTLFWLGDAWDHRQLRASLCGLPPAIATDDGGRRALSLVGYYKQFFGNLARPGMACQGSSDHRGRGPRDAGRALRGTAYVTEDPVESESLARRALEIGRANGNADLELLAMTAVGNALVQQGRPRTAWRCSTR